MTDTQKQKITALRKSGHSYSAIAAKLGISENTVKSHCRRNKSKECVEITDNTKCMYCDKPLIQLPKRKQKKFCSDDCRFTWWKKNKESSESIHKIRCENCANIFLSYGNAKRKYCGIPCYMTKRFKGGATQ